MVTGLSTGSYMGVFWYVLVGAVSMLALPLTAAAAVQLTESILDHAVVQRDRPVRIWGWGLAGENVTVRFHDQTVTAQTDPMAMGSVAQTGVSRGTLHADGKRRLHALLWSARIFWSAMCGWLQGSRIWSFPWPVLPAPFPRRSRMGKRR